MLGLQLGNPGFDLLVRQGLSRATRPHIVTVVTISSGAVPNVLCTIELSTVTMSIMSFVTVTIWLVTVTRSGHAIVTAGVEHQPHPALCVIAASGLIG